MTGAFERLTRRLRPTAIAPATPPPAYFARRNALIHEQVADQSIMARFAAGANLPPDYAAGQDERFVEYPWVIATLSQYDPPSPRPRLLDVGSALNVTFMLEHPAVRRFEPVIVTLEPEPDCHWRRRVGYLFLDARELPFRDDWFDVITCVSTLEHIGCDNTRSYTANPAYAEHAPETQIRAVLEMYRTLKPGGRLLVTVPFGRARDYGWYTQYDAVAVDAVISALQPAHVRETCFQYRDGSWRFSTREACAECLGAHAPMPPEIEHLPPEDRPAASMAVAALEIHKR